MYIIDEIDNDFEEIEIFIKESALEHGSVSALLAVRSLQQITKSMYEGYIRMYISDMASKVSDGTLTADEAALGINSLNSRGFAALGKDGEPNSMASDFRDLIIGIKHFDKDIAGSGLLVYRGELDTKYIHRLFNEYFGKDKNQER